MTTLIESNAKVTTRSYYPTLPETHRLDYCSLRALKSKVIGHLYSALLWDEPIAKALRYGP